ncbi:MAG: condensation domain-containing protein, partial [Verrucomicrobia bacterium]|nr:condensation domain-containing protein [Verrucomicrobiota bacterium]
MRKETDHKENFKRQSERANSEILSFAQQRLWFLDKLMGPNPVYNIGRQLKLVGDLDKEALRRSMNEIVRRHNVLRSSFREEMGEPIQLINDHLTIELPVVSLEELKEDKRKLEAIRLEKEEAERPFDLGNGPLIRAMLVRMEPQHHLLNITIHHIVFDGWSIDVFNRELSILYSTYRKNAVSPLEVLTMQYPEYAVRQREWLQGEALEKEMSYWRRQLANLPVIDLPTDHPRPKMPSFKGSNLNMPLTSDLTEQLEVLGRKNKATNYMVLLSAFMVLLHRYTSQNEIVVGSPIAGRTRVELEQMIGFFVNTLILRTDLSGDPPFDELLARVVDVSLNAFTNQQVPFEKLVEELQPERELNRNPLIQIMFAFQNAKDDGLKLDSLDVEELPREEGTSKFDLTLLARKQDGMLEIKANYATDLFNKSTIERMLGHYGKLLEGIADDPGKTISKLPILTESEERRMLVGWNNTEKAYPKDLCAHHLFENQAKRTPDKVALVFDGQTMTYAELDEKANQIANHL